MRRLYVGMSLLAGIALLLSLGATWWSVTLANGVVLPVTGVAASPVASSLLAVCGAAFGLGLLLQGTARRLVSGLQALAAAGVAYALVGVAGRPEDSVLAEIVALTGVTGSRALDAVVLAEATGFIWVAALGVLGTALSGVVGALMPDKASRANRYQRLAEGDDLQDPIQAWDRLSEGNDPTTR